MGCIRLRHVWGRPILVLNAIERRVHHSPTADETLDYLERTLALQQAAQRTLGRVFCLPPAGQIGITIPRQKGIDC